MKNKDINETKLKNGGYCLKEVAGCLCAVGYPYERMCPDCRDDADRNESDFCTCSDIKTTKNK